MKLLDWFQHPGQPVSLRCPSCRHVGTFELPPGHDYLSDGNPATGVLLGSREDVRIPIVMRTCSPFGHRATASCWRRIRRRRWTLMQPIFQKQCWTPWRRRSGVTLPVASGRLHSWSAVRWKSCVQIAKRKERISSSGLGPSRGRSQLRRHSSKVLTRFAFSGRTLHMWS